VKRRGKTIVGVAVFLLAVGITVAVIAGRSPRPHPVRLTESQAIAMGSRVAVSEGGLLLDATATFHANGIQGVHDVPIWYVSRSWCIVGTSNPMHGYTDQDFAVLDAHSGRLLHTYVSLGLPGNCTNGARIGATPSSG
jgi:hypothetical protein